MGIVVLPTKEDNAQMGSLLYIIGAVLVALWLIGFLMHIGGGLIHIILVIAVIVFLFQFLTGRRSV
jgi:4-hydroxybenzoate polyprenyltransferase